ncbi:MAG: helix-turn-helix domain-containing protein [Oscillospiraceae bacterium]|jgi:transcriptional regulator with XRE-family HTH domain|nr:helix-turn-helix domain-containing protein [Oscillospiraceae bacterium]
MVYEGFTQERIARLRTQKGVSARDMSLTLGQNDTYINKIENHKALPSLPGLFYICEFFGVTPHEFFDVGTEYPMRLKALSEDLKRLDDSALGHLSALVKEMIGKPK